MTRICWIVKARGRRFPMIGEACTYEEALAGAQLIWPDAEVER